MSANSTTISARLMADALRPHRDRLANDSVAFTRASLMLARSQLGSQAPTNAASPQRNAALQALSKWKDAVGHALKSVRAVDRHAAGRRKAVEWLTTLEHALADMQKALTLSDAHAAATAAAAARKGIADTHALAAQLAQVLA